MNHFLYKNSLQPGDLIHWQRGHVQPSQLCRVLVVGLTASESYSYEYDCLAFDPPVHTVIRVEDLVRCYSENNLWGLTVYRDGEVLFNSE